MGIWITAEKWMTSDVTEHRAEATPEGWTVTLLPGRFLDRNAAITALTLAEVYAQDPPPDSDLWVHVRSWEQELGLDGSDRR
ncbi:hypothetical protein ILP97_11560 [Amycolatopsis sp. H6(2020)]|nr:hypothetical protein [Amycolatopsis sp. H6(2020)]